jgi:ferredoxin-type protein NapH
VTIGSKRKITQVLALIVFNLGFFRILKTGFLCPSLYCYGCPFALFACPIGVLQNFVTFRQVPFFTFGSLGVYGMLLGRVFCGWACPFGALHDLVGYLKGEKSVKTPRCWYIKYIVLFVVLALAWITLDTVFCKFCPSGSLFAAIPFFILHPNSSLGTFFYVHILTLIATLILAYLVAHFWCRYLCPLGAIHGIFNKVSLLNIRFDEKKCTKCEVCLEVCPMGIDKVDDIGSSTDCTMCGRCVDKCPEKALSFVVK